MRVAIVHYHLKAGGVSTVIRQASQELTLRGIDHVILCGRSQEDDLPIRLIPELDYCSETSKSAQEILHQMKRAAEDALGGMPEIWHFHNHSLGKHVLMSEVVTLLAHAGERLFLQLHDLAEEGRPQNYLLISQRDQLYPVSSRIRYAFLNSRDRDRFVSAGLRKNHAYEFPNIIPSIPKCQNPAVEVFPKDGLVLYPSRGIRRKNLGELLLLSLYAPLGVRFAITQAPENANARSIYDGWVRMATDLKLPIKFDVVDRISPHEGADASYDAWIHAATHYATTSVAEGFGMIFSEAAALNKPLLGREIPSLPQSESLGLYRRISIPSEWISPERIRVYITRNLEATYRLYQRKITSREIDAAVEALYREGDLDFGNLPEGLQREILFLLKENPSLYPMIHDVPMDEWWEKVWMDGPAPYSGGGIEEDQYGETLEDHYQALMDADIGDLTFVSPDRVLDEYLRPEQFHFLMTSPQKIRAVIFDIYGTLLIAPSGAVKPDKIFDSRLWDLLESKGYDCYESPTRMLYEAVVRHHASSGETYPEVDLRSLWQEILGTQEDMTDLVSAVEDAWHPCEAMPQATEVLSGLAEKGILLGMLSNAQSNTLGQLRRLVGDIDDLFESELTILSYQHGMAKPSPALFNMMRDRLKQRGILPEETLYVGNDPRQDILPATAVGFRTGLFIGHPGSLRSGACVPDLIFRSLSEILPAITSI